MPISRLIFTASLLTLAAAAGCAYQGSKISLDETAIPAQFPNLVMVDQRDAEERLTRKNMNPCETWYSDEKFTPGKLAYLSKLLAQRVPAGEQARVTIDTFDTIDICEKGAREGATAAVTGVSMSTGVPASVIAGPSRGSDQVQFQLDGQINGKPFSITRRFVYDDLSPDIDTRDAGLFRERLLGLFDRCADEIIAAGYPKRPAG